MRTLVLGPALAAGLAMAAPSLAHADGWWEACNDQQGGNGCSDGMGNYSCQCDTAQPSSSSKRAASIGTGLALLGLVAYRLGRKRRSR